MVAKGFEWLPIATFYLLFVLYLIVSAVLLINLLIAMMGARYGEKMNNAHIDTRVDFGRLVLRLEMLFEITLCRPDIPVNQLPDNDDEEHFSSERSQRGPSDYGEAGSSGTAPDMAHPHTFSAKMRRASATFRSDKSDIKALQNMTCTNIFESDEEPDSDAASPSASMNAAGAEAVKVPDIDKYFTLLDARLDKLERSSQEQVHLLRVVRTANVAEAEIKRAREAQLQQAEAIEEAKRTGGQQGERAGSDDLLSKHIESIAVASRKANEATEKAYQAAVSSAAAAAAVSSGSGRDGSSPRGSVRNPHIRAAFDDLRRLTKSLDSGADIKRRVSAALSRVNAALGPAVQFVSHTHWPLSQPLFVSYAEGDYRDPAPPLLQVGSIRAFLQELFPPEQVEGVSPDAVQALAEALDHRGDGQVDEARLCASWLSWFGDRSRPRHALIVVGMQKDLIDGALALTLCDAGQDGSLIVDTINRMRRSATFDAVAFAIESHPKNHCSFHNVVTEGRSEAKPHADQDPNEIRNAEVYQRVVLQAPDGQRMPQMLWPSHCITDTPGAQMPPSLKTEPEDITVLMGTDACVDSHSAFYDVGKYRTPTTPSGNTLITELSGRGITHVYVCGLAFDLAVANTALHAAVHGLVAHVIHDASCSASVADARMRERELKSAGVRIVGSDDVPLILSERASLDDVVYAARDVGWVRKCVDCSPARPAHGVMVQLDGPSSASPQPRLTSKARSMSDSELSTHVSPKIHRTPTQSFGGASEARSLLQPQYERTAPGGGISSAFKSFRRDRQTKAAQLAASSTRRGSRDAKSRDSRRGSQDREASCKPSLAVYSDSV